MSNYKNYRRFGAKIKYLIEEPCNLKLAKVTHRLHLNDTEIHLAKPSAGRRMYIVLTAGYVQMLKIENKKK